MYEFIWVGVGALFAHILSVERKFMHENHELNEIIILIEFDCDEF